MIAGFPMLVLHIRVVEDERHRFKIWKLLRQYVEENKLLTKYRGRTIHVR
ncbi:unnamed protein product, partial [Acanthoscelides obtectus]